MRKCPVCPRTDIPEDTLLCPGCGADLKPLKRIEELPLFYFNQALDHAKKGSVEKALGSVSAALALDPGFCEGRVFYAKLLWQGKYIHKAKSQLETVLEKDANNQEAQKQLKQIKAYMKRRKQATAFLSIAAFFIIVLSVSFMVQTSNRHARQSEKAGEFKLQLANQSNELSRVQKELEQANRKHAYLREYIRRLKDMMKQAAEQ